MTKRYLWGHVFFVLSWICGSFALWVTCKNVFKNRILIWWIVAITILGAVLALADHYARKF